MLAKQHKLGSNVVICTDGEANTGLGAFNQGYGDDDDSDAFYKKLGQIAADSGVTVNLIAVVGAQCNIQALSSMCAKSGGLVHNVKGIEFAQSLTESLEQQMVASQVTIKIKLHPCLKFRNEDAADLSQDGSRLTRHVGNASTENITFTFEYEIKSVRELLKMNLRRPLEEILNDLPF